MHTKRRGRCAGCLMQCWVQQVFDVQWSVSMLGASAAALHASAPTIRPTCACVWSWFCPHAGGPRTGRRISEEVGARQGAARWQGVGHVSAVIALIREGEEFAAVRLKASCAAVAAYPLLGCHNTLRARHAATPSVHRTHSPCVPAPAAGRSHGGRRLSRSSGRGMAALGRKRSLTMPTTAAGGGGQTRRRGGRRSRGNRGSGHSSTRLPRSHR